MRAEVMRHNLGLMRQATARAQACIDEIAARDPRADAARDIARGDPTPIGISFRAHDPPDIATVYPGAEACRGYVSGRTYKPTGKWLTRTPFGLSFMPAPNASRCEDSARRYATAYNQHLSGLAPAAVQRFCRPRMERDGPLVFRP